jgi:hypothetical protein
MSDLSSKKTIKVESRESDVFPRLVEHTPFSTILIQTSRDRGYILVQGNPKHPSPIMSRITNMQELELKDYFGSIELTQE